MRFGRDWRWILGRSSSKAPALVSKAGDLRPRKVCDRASGADEFEATQEGRSDGCCGAEVGKW